MEILIIIVLFIIAGPLLHVGAMVLIDPQIVKRTVKVVKSNLNRPKQLVPGIVTPDMKALEPRNKDWGPDGKLTQMWQDAFDYWQIENPQEVMASFRKIDKQLKEHKTALEKTIELSDAVYATYLRPGSYSVGVHQAVDAKSRARDARRELASVESKYLRLMSPDEKVMHRLAERYGTEVYYNNDMVRLSSQKNMPTFDYIALTSV